MLNDLAEAMKALDGKKNVKTHNLCNLSNLGNFVHSSFFGLVFGFCWLLSLSAVASPPPAVGPVWRPGPVFTLVPRSGYLVAAVTAQLPCCRAGSVVVLCRPSFILSHGSKGS